MKLNSCVKSVVFLIMYYDSFHPTAALQHGLAMKILAKQKYQSLQSKCHKGLKLKYVQLTILEEWAIIAVSPDCQGACKCCGDSILEVKSSHNIKHKRTCTPKFRK